MNSIETIFTWVPLALISLGVLATMRTGIVNMGVEGEVCLGSFIFILFSDKFNPIIGVFFAALVLVAVEMILVYAITKLKTNAFLTGLSILTASSVLSLVLTIQFYEDNNKASVTHPEKLMAPSVWLIVGALTILITIFAFKRIYILRIGRLLHEHESPFMASVAGFDTLKIRLLSACISGTIIAIACAALITQAGGNFGPNFASNNGFLALAIVLICRLSPIICLFGALIFSFLSYQISIIENLGSKLEWIPYVSAFTMLLVYEYIRKNEEKKLSE